MSGWWGGQWWGDGSSSSSSAPVVITNNVTTVEELRDHMIALIQAQAPSVHSGAAFLAFLDEDAANFTAWAEDNVGSCLRRFQVRDTGEDNPPDITDTQVEARFVTFEISIAYPQIAQLDRDDRGARERDDTRRSDQRLLEQLIGLNGYQYFTGATYPNAAWIRGNTTRPIGNGVDFLRITQTMRFFQRMVP